MNFDDFHFVRPWVLWFLAGLPFLLAVYFAGERQRQTALNILIAPRLQSRIAGSVSLSKRRWMFLFTLLGMACAVVAAAQPRWGFRWEERTSRGRDIIVAIDTSRSMLAQDLKPNRLQRAKLAGQDLLGLLDGDRVGLVAFAGTSFLQAPLTADYDAIQDSLVELDTEIIPRGGTNLTEAIKTAEDAFGKGESEHRALIIFTDGEELEADAVEAARAARQKFRIFTVGLGSAEGGLIPFTNERGGTEFVRDNNGAFVTSRLDESRLREIAEAAGGFYVRLENGPAEMQRVVSEGLGKMKESDADSRFSKQPIERYQWPLGAAVVSLVVALFLGDRRRLRVRTSAATVFACFLPFTADAVPQEEFNKGCDAFKKGNYSEAAQAFGAALGTGSSELQIKAAYNLANTLARRGAGAKEKAEKISEWKDALQHYDRALALEPGFTDARHNRDIVQKAIEALEKSEEQKKDDKKDDQKKDDQQKQNESQENKDDSGKGEGKDDQQQQQQSQDKKESGQPQKSDGKSGEQKDGEEKGKGSEEKSDDKQPGEKQDGSEKKENGNPSKEQKQGAGGDQKKDAPKPGDPKPDPNAQPEPERSDQKPQGELKSANNPSPQAQPGQDMSEAEQEALAAAEGKMSEKQAKRLLDSIKDERVRLLDPREERRPPRQFKDW